MIPAATFPISNFLGAKPIPATAVPDAITEVALQLDGTQMTDPALLVVLALDFSPDAGATWASEAPGPSMNPFPVVVEFQGGATDTRGKPLSTYSWQDKIPPGANRQVKGSLAVSGAPLNTTATLAAG